MVGFFFGFWFYFFFYTCINPGSFLVMRWVTWQTSEKDFAFSKIYCFFDYAEGAPCQHTLTQHFHPPMQSLDVKRKDSACPASLCLPICLEVSRVSHSYFFFLLWRVFLASTSDNWKQHWYFHKRVDMKKSNPPSKLLDWTWFPSTIKTGDALQACR